MNQDLAFLDSFCSRKVYTPSFFFFFEISVHFVGQGVLELSPPASASYGELESQDQVGTTCLAEDKLP